MAADGNLSGMRPRLVNARIKGRGRAHQRLQRHGSSNIGQLRHTPCARHRQCATAVMACVPLSSARPSLAASCTGCNRHAAALRRPHALALVERFALADDHERQMGQRRQIAAGADRALLRNHRMHARH